MKTLILSSNSPRRADLLKQAGIPHKAQSNYAKETYPADMLPHEIVMHIAEKKANYALKNITNKNSIILTADTICSLGNKIFGKPRTPALARDMLSELQGQTHEVLTGFSLLDVGANKILTDYECTEVAFRFMSADEIMNYVKAGESVGKAGGYALQGEAIKFIENIKGDYTNVIGLPIPRIYQALRDYFNFFE